jgi:hypothetical protein
MNVVDSKQKEWKGTSFSDSYLEAKQKSAEFTTYKNTDKRTWVAEKQDVDTLLGNIQTKLKTYNLAPYVPPSGLSLVVSTCKALHYKTESADSKRTSFFIFLLTGPGQELARSARFRSQLSPKHQWQDSRVSFWTASRLSELMGPELTPNIFLQHIESRKTFANHTQTQRMISKSSLTLLHWNWQNWMAIWM